MNPLFHTDFSISDSLKNVRKSVLIYETIIIKPIAGNRTDYLLYIFYLIKLNLYSSINNRSAFNSSVRTIASLSPWSRPVALFNILADSGLFTGFTTIIPQPPSF